MYQRKYDERQKVLETQDGDGEGVLHPEPGPSLHTQRVRGPGQRHGLDSLEHEDGRGHQEGEAPDGEVDEDHLGVGELGGEAGGDLGDGQPPVHGDGGDGGRADEGVGPLQRGHQLARSQPQVPLAAVQTLHQRGRDAQQRGRDPGDTQVQDVNIFRRPVHFSACKQFYIH